MKIKTQQWGVKTLLVVSALGTSILVLNCGETKREIEGKPITVTKYVPVEAKNFNYVGHIVKHLAASRDGNNLYVAVDMDAGAPSIGKFLFHNDGQDLAQGYKVVKLETEFDESPGKAKLETAKDVTWMSAAKDGVLISVTGTRPALSADPDDSLDNGVVYIKGGKAENAWANRDQDVGSVPGNNPQAGKFTVSTSLTGIVVTNDGEDVPYFFGRDSFGAVEYVAMTREDLKAGAATALVKRAGTVFAGIPKLAAGGNFLFAMDDVGMSAIAKADIGKTHDFPNVAKADAADANGRVGIKSFIMKAGEKNNDFRAIIATDKHVFIGFGAPRPFTGGVGVYEIGTTNLKAPDVSWNRIGIKDLLRDSKGKIWAVTENDVIEVNDDGTRGQSYIAQFESPVETFEGAKGGLKTESFPRDKITTATFLKDKLVVGTDKGLFVPKDIQKVIRGTKVIEVEGK